MIEALHWLRMSAVVLAVVGWVVPCPAAGEERVAAKTKPKVHDIQLDKDGSLHVVVVDAEGQTLQERQVRLTRSGDTQSTVGVTDNNGRHKFERLSGGIYQLQTDQGICACRVWTASAAPPSAAQSLLIINDTRIERGQRPIREIFHSDPLLMTAIVAAAIAIPIAIHQSRDKSSGS